MSEVPEWARDRAVEIADGTIVRDGFIAKRFARYIAEHEEAPVDPLIKNVSIALAKAMKDAGADRTFKWSEFGPFVTASPEINPTAYKVIEGFISQLALLGIELRGEQ